MAAEEKLKERYKGIKRNDGEPILRVGEVYMRCEQDGSVFLSPQDIDLIANLERKRNE